MPHQCLMLYGAGIHQVRREVCGYCDVMAIKTHVLAQNSAFFHALV